MDDDKKIKNFISGLNIPDPSTDLVANILHETKPTYEGRSSWYAELARYFILPKPAYALSMAMAIGICLGIFSDITPSIIVSQGDDWDIINSVFTDEDYL